MAFPLRKYKLIFTDGTTETVETVGLALAWFKGKLMAAKKGTVLLKVEEATEKRFYVRYIDLATGRTVEKTISEAEQHELYRLQREGMISIIEIKKVGEEVGGS